MSFLTKLLSLVAAPGFNRPIFLVGCAKSGTTLTGALFSRHPEIKNAGHNKPKWEKHFDGNLNSLTNLNKHGKIAATMEEKKLWDSYLPVYKVPLTIGVELSLKKWPHGIYKANAIKWELKSRQTGSRLFNKAPFNTFRVHVLRELFPDSKILCINRDGRDVISSWGREHDRWNTFGGFEKSIRLFASKWNDSIEYINMYKKDLNIFTFKYEDLISEPQKTIQQIFEFSELEYLPEIYDNLFFENRLGKWKERIPAKFHDLCNELTIKNRTKLDYL